jgi:uncharacterized LabA/DUF88 family protein
MRKKPVYAFIDASNLFYGGLKSLGWRIDYLKLLKYLIKKGKKVIVLARSERTAKEIRQIAKGNFRDFNYLREILKFEPRK